MNRITIGAGAAALILAGAAASYFSPHITLYQMKAAIEQNDAGSFSEHVDFPALRDSFKGQMMVVMNQKLNPPGMKDNRFAGFRTALAAAFVGPMVDPMVSPAGVIAMMQTGKPTSAPSNITKISLPSDAGKQRPDFTISYRGWSEVEVQPKSKGSEEMPKFVFKREGLWSWKLAAIDMP